LSLIATLIGRLPRGGDTRPAEPLLPADEVARQLAEIGADRGVSNHVLGAVSAALGKRLDKDGIAEDFDRPWPAALRHLPGPEGDTFAGRSLDRQDQNPAERTLRTAAWARAGAEVLQEAAAEHPALRSLRRDDGGASRLEPLAAGPIPVAIIVMKGVWTLENAAGRSVAELASEIGTALASGQFQRIEDAGHQRAPLAVLSDRRTLQHARHGHRANGLQGPWACLAPASRSAYGPPMELMGGWSLVAEHELLATLAARIYKRADGYLNELDDSTFQWLGRVMTRGFIDAWRSPESSVHRQAEGAREEFLAAEFPKDLPVERLAWAVGAAAQRFLGRQDEIGIPLRVESAGHNAVLGAVCFPGGQPESAETFADRLDEQQRRERAGQGVMGDALRRTVGQASSASARARMLSRARQRGPFGGPYGWVTGVARVARLQTDESTPWALYAGSSAPSVAPLADVGGGLSVTLLVGPDRIELGLVGTGPFSERGALDRIAELIAEFA
jgi:hypothetical protein